MVSHIAKCVLATALLAPAFAHAEGSASGSQFFYQVEAGKSAVTPELATASVKQKLEGGGKEDQSATALAVSYEYGLTADLAVGGKLGYVMSGKVDDGTGKLDMKGLQDLGLFVKGSTEAGSGHLKYGAELSLSPGDKKIETADVNAYSGRHTLEPYIGYQMTMAPCVFGVKLSKEIGLGDGKIDNTGTKIKYTGNEDTTISLFYEHEMNADMRIGVSLDWITTTDIKLKDPVNADDESASPTQDISVYAPMKVGNGELLPSFTYSMSTDDKVNGTKLDSYKGTELNVGYRMTF